MVKQEKIETVKKLRDALSRAKSFVLLNYQGLGVEASRKLRTELEKNNSYLKVAKNTLLKRAFAEISVSIPQDSLEGPTAILTSEATDFSAFKVLANFIKETSLPKIKLGFWDKKFIGEEQVLKLASLPDRQELINQLIGYLSSPFYNLNFVLDYNLNTFINTLDRIKTKKT